MGKSLSSILIPLGVTWTLALLGTDAKAAPRPN
ncbi:uncharacterized protein METZ01_LOCUS297392, partial [marine metagenome]